MKHSRNSRDRWGTYDDICVPVFEEAEKDLKRIIRSGDIQKEKIQRSFLYHIYGTQWSKFKKSRKKKEYLRKSFKHWYALGHCHEPGTKIELHDYAVVVARNSKYSRGAIDGFPYMWMIMKLNEKALTDRQRLKLSWVMQNIENLKFMKDGTKGNEKLIFLYNKISNLTNEIIE